MTTQQIQQRLNSILSFMQPYWEFVNSHMVNYITHKHWQQFIPIHLQQEVPNIERIQQCIEQVFWQHADTDVAKSNFPNFMQFILKTQQHTLDSFPEITTSLQDFYKLFKIQNDNDENLSIKEFMSEKKNHEVEITAKLVNQIIQNKFDDKSKDELIIIDAGDGKGYLSSRLALQYDYNVLGIDYKASNSEGAADRSKKLQRAWTGLKKRAELINQGIKPPRRNSSKQQQATASIPTGDMYDLKQNYKTVSHFITTDLNILEIYYKLFPHINKTTEQYMCLTGLHTCGNLASTCLQVFQAQEKCRLLCNVGCCYHLLKEEYSQHEYQYNNYKIEEESISVAGFPLSQFLREQQQTLGRNARMLAAQSIERTLATKESPSISLYYRAVLEVIITDINKNSNNKSIQVGRIRKFKSFNDYLEICLKKSSIDLEGVNLSDLLSYEMKYINDKYYLELYYLIRMLFAPVIETIILLDRLLYLKEFNYNESFLIPLFDAVISPRRFAIISIK